MRITLKKICMMFFVSLFLITASFPAYAENGNLTEGTYKVNITLETKAPLPAVKKAFASAFGEYAIVTVSADGGITAKMQNKHMKISDNDANVLSIKGADVETTKTEKFSNPKTKAQEDVDCPDIFTVELNTDENNSQVLTVTVDYMNQFLGGGNDYETDVTLTLDFQNAQKVESDFDFTPVNEITVTETNSQSSNDTSLSSGTKYTIIAITAVIIIAVVVILIIKKKKDDEYFKEYMARKAEKEGLNYDDK
ncbi:MAG: hypothetical protein ACI4V4_01135 [Eubacterium sp.]